MPDSARPRLNASADSADAFYASLAAEAEAASGGGPGMSAPGTLALRVPFVVESLVINGEEWVRPDYLDSARVEERLLDLARERGLGDERNDRCRVVVVPRGVGVVIKATEDEGAGAPTVEEFVWSLRPPEID